MPLTVARSMTGIEKGFDKMADSTKSVRLSRRHAGAAHLPHLMQCIISLCFKIWLWLVSFVGRLAMGRCPERDFKQGFQRKAFRIGLEKLQALQKHYCCKFAE